MTQTNQSEKRASNATDRLYDVVVLGAGPVGQTVAARTREQGLSVVVIERELVGGECSYWGCVPSKAMLRPVLALADALRVDGAREAVTSGAKADTVFARRDRYTTDWDDSAQFNAVTEHGVDVVRGHGRLAGPRRVIVTKSGEPPIEYAARQAVIVSVGSTARLPDTPGIDQAHPWTNRMATDSHTVPARLAVVGGGGVGAEMATAWRGLGSQVTLLVRDDQLLPSMEPFVGEHVSRGLVQAGVDVRTNVSVTRLHRPTPGDPVVVTLDSGENLTVDEILFAIGRIPNTGDIGLETVGLQPGSWIDVDDSCTARGVEGSWLYALGDANHRALLTHQGKYQARIAGDAIVARAHGQSLDTLDWGAHVATADTYAVPQAFFTDPEAGSVGLTAGDAVARGHRVRSVDVDMGAQVPGANFYADGYTGRARLVLDLDRGVMLGFTFVGPGVAELLHAATIAVVGQVPIDRLWHAVPCFPTISEVWLKLLEACRDNAATPAR